MSSLGQTLRQAREAKGLTQSKVAAETRILVQIIDDIENEDFHRIAAPIYGRGFVRLFAECVGLDPQPLIREFMDIYAGRRAPTVHVREVPAPEPAPVPEPAPPSPNLWDPPTAGEPEVVKPFSAPEPDPAIEPDRFDYPEPQPIPAPPPLPESLPPEPEPVPEPAPEPPPVVRGLDLFEQTGTAQPPPHPFEQSPQAPVSDSPFLPPNFEEHGPSVADRFRTGLSSVSHGVVQSMRDIPRSAWRKGVLALGALAALALIVFGCVKLYQMTTPPSNNGPDCANGVCEYTPPPKPSTPTTPPAAKPDPAPTSPKSAAPAKQSPVRLRATGQTIPPLYAD
ncbi:MAG: helix-turn-helix domain-containing protein [Kiritimatiellia bacterium]